MDRATLGGRALAAACSLLSLQDPALKLCLVQSVCMVCQAIRSSAQAGCFHFAQKAELVAQMMVRAVQACGCRGRWGGGLGRAGGHLQREAHAHPHRGVELAHSMA